MSEPPVHRCESSFRAVEASRQKSAMEWLAVVRCGKKFAQSFVLFFFGTESLVRVAQTQQRKRRYPPPTETLPPPSPKNKTKTKRQKTKTQKMRGSTLLYEAQLEIIQRAKQTRRGPGRAGQDRRRAGSRACITLSYSRSGTATLTLALRCAPICVFAPTAKRNECNG